MTYDNQWAAVSFWRQNDVDSASHNVSYNKPNQTEAALVGILTSRSTLYTSCTKA